MIGNLIFQNECAGRTSCLTSWNQGEAFPSLGIGHFIWYPENSSGPFEESFPKLVYFMVSQGTKVPEWLNRAIKHGAPWPSREAFLKLQNSDALNQLRDLLSVTHDIQAAFMIRRMNRALPQMLATLSTSEQKVIHRRFYRVADAPMGYYALIDYVNFKGEGTKMSERYQGAGWGLLQVLQEMNESGDVLESFSQAAEQVLIRRVGLSPPERNESRWLAGWKKRIDTYRKVPN